MSQDPRRSGPPAVIAGLGLRLPSGLHTPAALWQAMCDGVPLVSTAPDEATEQTREGLHPDQRHHAALLARGGHLAEGADALERDLFGPGTLTGAESHSQRLILAAAADCLADAGLPARALASRPDGPATAVLIAYAGVDEAVERFAPGRRVSPADLSTGGAGTLATPVMRWLDITDGPGYSLDSSCSSGMTALDDALLRLQTGRVDAAIVAGVNTTTSPQVGAAFAEAGVLDGTGCRPFDATAGGYVRSTGAVAMLLLSPALAQQWRVRGYAQLVHTALGHDGRGAGPAAQRLGDGVPNPAAQAALARRCWAEAGIEPGDIAYVEAHGTATRAGDRVELQALDDAAGRSAEDPLVAGSLKGLIGHTEGPAPLVGAVAAALQLHHGAITPTAAHTALPTRPARPGLHVPTRVMALPEGAPVAVAAVGFSGALGHAVLAPAPVLAPGSGVEGQDEGAGAEPEEGGALLISAPSTPGLAVGAAAAAAALRAGQPVGAVAAHLRQRRDVHPVAAAVAAPDAATATAGLDALAAGRPHAAIAGPRHRRRAARAHVVWLFAGHGTQHEAMGAQLSRAPAYAAARARMKAALQAAVEQQGEPGPVGRLHAAILAHQAGLAALLAPVAPAHTVMGLSVGEVAAALAAGALDEPGAARVVLARAAVLDRAEGGLLHARLDHTEAAALTGRIPGLEAVVRTGPTHAVLAGTDHALQAAAADLAACGVTARHLADSPPAHSALLAADPEALERAAHTPPRRAAQGAPVFRSAAAHEAGAAVDADELAGAYWHRQLTGTVDLEGAVAAVAARAPQHTVVIEIGGRSVLGAPVAETIAAHGLDAAIAAAGGADPGGEYAGWCHQAAEVLARGGGPVPGRARPTGPPVGLGGQFSAPAAPVAAAAVGAAPRGEAARAAVRDHMSAITGRPVEAAEDDTDLLALGVDSAERSALLPALRKAAVEWADLAPTDLFRAASVAEIAEALDELSSDPSEESAGQGP